MNPFVVVTGTDTGVGKTFVGCALARALVRAGRRVLAVKPLESGCGEAPPEQEDGALLAAATGQPAPRQALLRLRTPVTPALAADEEGITIDWNDLVSRVRAAGAGHDVVLVEGAGGLLSPLTWSHDATHLAHALEARVLLVASDRLGVLHHVRAAVQVLANGGQLPVGLVLSAPAAPDASTGTNAAALRRLLAPHGALAGRLASVPRTNDLALASEAVAPVLEWLSS